MDRLEKTAARLEALGNTTRLSVYRLLVRAGDEGLSVGTIQQRLNVPASTLSHHLKHLESIDLVTRHKQGVTHHCTANYDTMDAVLEFLTEECCADAEIPNPEHKHI